MGLGSRGGAGGVGGAREAGAGLEGWVGLGGMGRGPAGWIPALTFAVAGRARVGSGRLWPHHEEARPWGKKGGLELEAGWEAGLGVLAQVEGLT